MTAAVVSRVFMLRTRLSPEERVQVEMVGHLATVTSTASHAIDRHTASLIDPFMFQHINATKLRACTIAISLVLVTAC